ncbi:hypothetical protein [Carboxylicivirga sp. RSCT41]|uniref:carboxylate--amine ligase n=1 Tax=Carboxylicivirga agarovorans TaxID=3417570 RepID=UPI003D336587
MKTESTLNPVVVLDITHSGYGILRSLHKYNIPLYGFTYDAGHLELKTKLTKETFVYSSNNDLRQKLISLAQKLPQRPVLMLTNDEKVEFVLDEREELEKHFIINMPTTQTVQQLIDKIKLNAIIDQLNIRVPRTINIENIEHGKQVAELTFPVIVKPFLKSEKWNKAGFSKAIIFNAYDEFAEVFPKMFEAENRIIAQEFIPGGDDHIYYCLAYYSVNGELKSHFTGQKIRQWRILTGSTTSTKPVNEAFVTNESIRIFDAIGYNGLGSIEFKKHQITGDFYMIEPTVGRVDTQQYIATCSGNNIPLKAYCDMTGHQLHGLEKQNDNAVFIDEVNEIQSFFEYNTKYGLTVGQWLSSIKGKKHFRYLSTVDPNISLRILYHVTRRLTGHFLRRMLNGKS